MNCIVTLRIYGRGLNDSSPNSVSHRDIVITDNDGKEISFGSRDGNISLAMIADRLSKLKSKHRLEQLNKLELNEEYDDDSLLEETVLDKIYDSLDKPAYVKYDFKKERFIDKPTKDSEIGDNEIVYNYTVKELFTEHNMPVPHYLGLTKVLLVNSYSRANGLRGRCIIKDTTLEASGVNSESLADSDIYVITESELDALSAHLNLLARMDELGKKDQEVLEDDKIKACVTQFEELLNRKRNGAKVELATFTAIKNKKEKLSKFISEHKSEKKEAEDFIKGAKEKLKNAVEEIKNSDKYASIKGKTKGNLTNDLKSLYEEQKAAIDDLTKKSKEQTKKYLAVLDEYNKQLKELQLTDEEKQKYTDYQEAQNEDWSVNNIPRNAPDLIKQFLKHLSWFKKLKVNIGGILYYMSEILESTVNKLRAIDVEKIDYFDPLSNLIEEARGSHKSFNITRFKNLAEPLLVKLTKELPSIDSSNIMYDIVKDQIAILKEFLDNKLYDIPKKAKKGESKEEFVQRKKLAIETLLSFLNEKVFGSATLDSNWSLNPNKGISYEGYVYLTNQFSTIQQSFNIGFDTISDFKLESYGLEEDGFNIYSHEIKGQTFYYVSLGLITPNVLSRRFLTIDAANKYIEKYWQRKTNTFAKHGKVALHLKLGGPGNIHLTTSNWSTPGSVIFCLDYKMDHEVLSSMMATGEYSLITKEFTLNDFIDRVFKLYLASTAYNNFLISKVEESGGKLTLDKIAQDEQLNLEMKHLYELKLAEVRKSLFEDMYWTPEQAAIFVYEMYDLRDAKNRRISPKTEFDSIEDLQNFTQKFMDKMHNIPIKYFLVDDCYKFDHDYEVSLLEIPEKDIKGNNTLELANPSTKRKKSQVPRAKLPVYQIIADKLSKLGVKCNLITVDELPPHIDPNAKAFIENGLININLSKASLQDMVHEYTHIFLGLLKSLNIDNYVRLMAAYYDKDKKIQDAIKYKKRAYPNASEYDLLEELFCDRFASYIIRKAPKNDLTSIFDGFIHEIVDDLEVADQSVQDMDKAEKVLKYSLFNKADSEGESVKLGAVLKGSMHDLMTTFSREVSNYLSQTLNNPGITIDLEKVKLTRQVRNRLDLLLENGLLEEKPDEYIIQEC